MIQTDLVCDIDGCELPAAKTIREGRWFMANILMDLCWEHYAEFIKDMRAKGKKKINL